MDNKKEQKPYDNSVFIGNKPFMNYVTSVVMGFTNQNSDEIIVKARGKLISRAVDVVEVAKSRFLDGVAVKDIKIGSDDCRNKDGRDVKVSFIEITMARN